MSQEYKIGYKDGLYDKAPTGNQGEYAQGYKDGQNDAREIDERVPAA